MPKLTKLLAACVVISSPAWAGEVTGNGDSTPIRSGVANSICAFSGQNDDGAGPNPAVQSYGQQVAFFRGRAPFHGIPGIECNGS